MQSNIKPLVPLVAILLSAALIVSTAIPENIAKVSTVMPETIAKELNAIQTRTSLRSFGGILYPQTSETRDLRTLNGIWNFRKSQTSKEGYKNKWYKQDLTKTGPVIPMPVPSSYNDVGEDASLRDHVGLVWYDRRFHVPSGWLRDNQRVWLRFSSVHYKADVYVNGKHVTSHEIGHLPFEVEITDKVYQNISNLLTVAVSNVLTSDTLPQGTVYNFHVDNTTKELQSYYFDFFNYAGIHRTVFLYSTPQLYIDDVIVNTTDIQGHTGIVAYNVTYKGRNNVQCLVQLYDKTDKQVASMQDCAGQLKVSNANLWWPHLMHHEPGYLYTLKASLLASNGETIDTYSQTIGIRTVKWSNTTIYLNDKPLYMRGFGMHEDSDLRGKGWDPVLWVKNFNLIRWVGANAFRTTHYPYAEEIYKLADEQGVMIIDECPGVNIDSFNNVMLKKHKQSLTELIRRDKNHPSVIMWSIANEPSSNKKEADAYFAEVVRHVKSMDLSRPITGAIAVQYNKDKAGQHLDVLCFNRYNGWYGESGILFNVANEIYEEAHNWHRQHNKPVVQTEYGAGTIAGLHMNIVVDIFINGNPLLIELMSEHFKAFDKLRRAGFFSGEFIWSFADFMTQESFLLTARVCGNKKGIFTRERQPKASAHHMRARYLALAAADSGAVAPDLEYYVSDHKPGFNEEL